MFSVNTLNSVTKNIHLLCEGPACYQSASKTHVGDRIFDFNATYPEIGDSDFGVHYEPLNSN